MIGHTQPRRIAARTVAERIAEELGIELGERGRLPGALHRPGRPRTPLVKVMTDGILLAEIQRDRMLRRYDTIIIDEAHERSLNIDFLLGYLKQLLPRRPDLKLIITSATIDPERFSPALRRTRPIVEVSGRTYPVEVRYRPLDRTDGDDDRDQIDGDRATRSTSCGRGRPATSWCSSPASGRSATPPTRCAGHLPDGTEVLPLYARLSAAEQHRVFAPHAGRRIVLATNVAETSLTVPGHPVRRRPRHRPDLPLQPPAPRCSGCRSSRSRRRRANQRAGRCGRVADGICIRLYAEEDFDVPARVHRAGDPAHQPGLGDPADDRARARRRRAPSRSSTRRTAAQVADGVALLQRAGRARDGRRRRSADPARPAAGPAAGRPAARPDGARGRAQRLPARGAGHRRRAVHPGPARAAGRAAAGGRRSRTAGSPTRRRTSSPCSTCGDYLRGAAGRAVLQRVPPAVPAEFLHYLRVREWQDLHGQLRSILRQLGIGGAAGAAAEADPTAVTRSLLAGLLSHVGHARGHRPDARASTRGPRRPVRDLARARRWPSKPPRWVMAAELVETTRLWARTVARIEPEWAEELAGHLVKRSYSEPHWSNASGPRWWRPSGSPCTACRSSSAGRSTTAGSTRCCPGSCSSGTPWSRATGRPTTGSSPTTGPLLAEVAELEDGPAGATCVVDDETLFDFYDAAGPGRRGVRPALRRVVEEGPARPARPAHLHPASCCSTPVGRACDAADYPGRVAPRAT